MKICIPTDSWKDEGGRVAEHFGHTEWFVILDTETGEKTMAANRVSRDRPGGCRAVRQVGELGIDAVACRKIGRKAAKALTQAGIKLLAAPGVTVDVVAEAALAGELEFLEVIEHCQQHHRHTGDCSHRAGGGCH